MRAEMQVKETASKMDNVTLLRPQAYAPKTRSTGFPITEWIPFAVVVVIAVTLAFKGNGYVVQVLTSSCHLRRDGLRLEHHQRPGRLRLIRQVAFFGLGAYLAAGLIVQFQLPSYGLPRVRVSAQQLWPWRSA